MDRDGVYAQVVYSPMTTQMRLTHIELRAACMRAYNDWAVDFNRVDPRRLLLLSHIPGQDEGVAPIFEDEWHPFWDAAEETGLPIHAHLGPRGSMLTAQLGSWRMPAFV